MNAYIPRDTTETALVRRVIEMTVRAWPSSDPDVTIMGFVREYLSDGLFALEVVRTDNREFDLLALDNPDWQTVERGAAWVQVDDDGALAVVYELDRDNEAQLAEYPPIITPRESLPAVPADTEEQLISVAELAAEHGVPYQTVVSARRSGKLAARRVGRNFATTRHAFRAWMGSRA